LIVAFADRRPGGVSLFTLPDEAAEQTSSPLRAARVIGSGVDEGALVVIESGFR
jgi:hypothetical protein